MSRDLIRPFRVAWTNGERATVLRQVADYELPPAPPGAGWSIGCSADTLLRLKTHWLERFDWQAAVDRLNHYPQFIANVEGLDVHFVSVSAETPNAPTVLMLHGWPSAHFEFFEVADRLTHPSRFGGQASDSVHLIIPSLPGYGFSGKPDAILGPRAIARIMNQLMTENLGISRYLAHGGDWGATITTWLGIDNAEHLSAIHLGMISLSQPGQPHGVEERAWSARFAAVQRELAGYSHLQGTRPQSLAWLAAGNPMGQLAWIVERLHDWADLRERSFEEVFDSDWMITLALVYIMTGSFRTAAYLYHGLALESGGSAVTLSEDSRCDTPTAFTNHLGDPRVVPPPRARAERAFNIVRWVDAPRGGHFPAHEEPEAFVADLLEWRRGAWGV